MYYLIYSTKFKSVNEQFYITKFRNLNNIKYGSNAAMTEFSTSESILDIKAQKTMSQKTLYNDLVFLLQYFVILTPHKEVVISNLI